MPYDSGQYGVRMGGGPDSLVDSGLPAALSDAGHDVDHREVMLPSAHFPAEVASAFALDRLLAEQVADADGTGAFPFVLSGNCMSSVGTLGGLGRASIGVVWFDAHGDFNTPETTIGGFLDGMALAVVTGRCWTQLASTVQGFRPVDEANVVLVGARDLDLAERELLDDSAVRFVPPPQLGEELTSSLDDLAARVSDVYVHVDLDVLDPSEGRANSYAAPSGVQSDELLRAIGEIGRRFAIRAAALTAFDPAYDGDGRVRTVARRIARAVADAAALRLDRPTGTQRRGHA
jgi:arginase